LGPLSRSVMSIERRLPTKISTRWTENCKTNPLRLINSSLEIDYCSMTLSNHGIVRLVRFVSKIKVEVAEWILLLTTFNTSN
jgi:hypothetical protein